MVKKVMQFRYYSKNDGRNQPNAEGSEITLSNLQSGGIFENYGNIIQLGIQTLPGTKFYLNYGINPIMVGSTGIYELDLEGLSPITKLAFDKKSLDSIEETPNAYLIIDTIYESEEEE